ncbi:MAG: DEAD/DEAH box helicase [Candidatus Odinarchaeota archaeon]|nr:DEAD/DEAH box helicase [Candidatus Odinarchaeota archaeon]
MQLEMVEELGLDEKLLEILEKEGIRQFSDIQRLAIKAGVFKGESLLLASPSASGKTLIGELVCVNTVLKNRGKAVFLVPLKAIAYEKYGDFKRRYKNLGIKIGISTGDFYAYAEDLEKVDIMVLTYERFDSLLRLNPLFLKDIRIVVIDEIQNLGEEQRGPRLENITIRLRNFENLQLLALSGTIGNPEQLAQWLKCKLIASKNRPVPLNTFILTAEDKNEAIKKLVATFLKKNCQTLIFVSRRRDAESLAEKLSNITRPFISVNEISELNHMISNSLKYEKTMLTNKVAKLALNGTGFHHAGLSTLTRSFVEEAFKKGLIKVLVCTTTLSTGINFPAHLVILRDLLVAKTDYEDMEINEININRVFQILGRAGRPTYGERGYSVILVHNENEKKLFQSKIFNTENGKYIPKFEPVTSKLAESGLDEALLVFIYENPGVSEEEIVEFFRGSFWCFQRGENCRESIRELLLIPGESIYEIVKANSKTAEFEAALKIQDSEVKILKSDADRLEAKVRSNMCSFSPNGPHCNCIIFSSLRTSLCRHLTKLALYIDNYLPDFKGVISQSLERKYVLDFLLSNKLVRKIRTAEKNVYETTNFGNIVVKLYLRPKTAIIIRESLKIGINDMKDFCEMFGKVLALEGRSVPPQFQVAILEVYENRIRLEEVPERFNISSGDFESLLDLSGWILHAIATIAKLEGYKDVSEKAKDLTRKLGVSISAKLNTTL